jgi:hypothetical protein
MSRTSPSPYDDVGSQGLKASIPVSYSKLNVFERSKIMKKIVSLVLVVAMVMAFASTALAYNQAVRGVYVYGGTNGSKVLSNVSREYSQMTITIYGDTQFSTESNITFRCYAVNSTTSTKSHAITFYAADWYSGQVKTAAYINSPGSTVDLRGSIPNTNSTAYAMFYGNIVI